MHAPTPLVPAGGDRTRAKHYAALVERVLHSRSCSRSRSRSYSRRGRSWPRRAHERADGSRHEHARRGEARSRNSGRSRSPSNSARLAKPSFDALPREAGRAPCPPPPPRHPGGPRQRINWLSGGIKLFVCNLPRSFQHGDVTRIFEPFGKHFKGVWPVFELVWLSPHYNSQQVCLIKYFSATAALEAIETLSDKVILPGCGAPLHLGLADGYQHLDLRAQAHAEARRLAELEAALEELAALEEELAADEEHAATVGVDGAAAARVPPIVHARVPPIVHAEVPPIVHAVVPWVWDSWRLGLPLPPLHSSL